MWQTRYWAYKHISAKNVDTFASLMYCSHLSIKPTQFMLGEKHESEETRYNQSETAHKTIFRCWDSNHIWVKNSENARNFCNYYELSSSRLTLKQIHNSQTSCSIYYLLNLLKAFDSSDIHYIRKLSTHAMDLIIHIATLPTPPFDSKSSNIKKNNLFHACNM